MPMTTKEASAQQMFFQCLRAFGQQDRDVALQAIQKAVQLCPEHILFQMAERYLSGLLANETGNVYETGEAFGAFIRGGGNVALYQKTTEALRSVYASSPVSRLLDIGVGDGKALLPSLPQDVEHVDVLEPSTPMLNVVEKALSERSVSFRSWNSTLEVFARESHDSWDLAQATFSLQSIQPDARREQLSWLSQHCKRFAIVEFDVPDFDEMFSEERMSYVLERYKLGLQEYKDHRELVGFGFLLPVMFGYFDPTQNRTNYEQSMHQWRREVEEAGFSVTQAKHISPYWWAPAFLLEATASS